MRTVKKRYFYHIFVYPGDAPGAITLVLYGWKENSMLTNCLAACAHLTITVSEIERDIGWKSSIFHTPFYPTPPLGGFPSEYRHSVWCGKTRMVWLPDDEKNSKISLFVFAQLTNVTDRQTDTASRHIPRLYAYASRGNQTTSCSAVVWSQLHLQFHTLMNNLIACNKSCYCSILNLTLSNK